MNGGDPTDRAQGEAIAEGEAISEGEASPSVPLLERGTFSLELERARKLHEMLVQLYPTIPEALKLAAHHQIRRTSLVTDGVSAERLWEELLSAAARSGVLRALVQEARNQFPHNKAASEVFNGLLAEKRGNHPGTGPRIGGGLSRPHQRPTRRMWLIGLAGVGVLGAGAIAFKVCRAEVPSLLILPDRLIRSMIKPSTKSPFEVVIEGRPYPLPEEGLLFANDEASFDRAEYEKHMGSGRPRYAGRLQRRHDHLEIVIRFRGNPCLEERLPAGVRIWELKYTQCHLSP